VVVVVGSRPEVIKMMPIVRALRHRHDEFDAVVCATGQQQHMIPQALGEFGVDANVDLAVMQPDQTLASLTARLMIALDETIGRCGPDWVLVQGDTTSAMVGALAAFYRRVPVGHVEAGLRTGNIASPFPEEVNRRMITACASLHFAPTSRCRDALLREGVDPATVRLTGNTVVDALDQMRQEATHGVLRFPPHVAEALAGRRLVLVTSHRRENFDHGMDRICSALIRLVAAEPDIVVVLPVHPNPRVSDTIRRRLDARARILLIDPVPYGAFLQLMARAYLVLTDSGGLQEEAPSFRKPVLVLRDTTERPEGVDAGAARLVGTDDDRIVRIARLLLRDSEAYGRMVSVPNPYGDGHAAVRIVEALAGRPDAAPAAPDPLTVTGVQLSGSTS
jgi:UDP-N-acetylglucosamine 2-epimerase